MYTLVYFPSLQSTALLSKVNNNTVERYIVKAHGIIYMNFGVIRKIVFFG